MDYKKTLEACRQIIAEKNYLSPDEVEEHADLEDDLGLDSLERVETIMALEKEFGQTMPPVDYEGIKTVRDLALWFAANAA